MEGESGLDSSSESTSLGTTKKLSFSEYADELCSFYMSIGVPCREYWYGDYTQLKHYFEAYKLAEDRFNYHAWLQGAYVYDAICCASPILHAFAKKGTKPIPYHKEPYGAKMSSIGSHEQDKPTKSEQEMAEIRALNASAKFASFMTQWNKKFENKGGELNGGDDRPVAAGDQVE